MAGPERSRQRALRRRRAARRRGLLSALALAAVIAAVAIAVATGPSSHHTSTVAAPAIVKVLVPEGETRAQIAQIAAADGLKGSYLAASRSSALLTPRAYGAPAGTPGLEGFLFPATYDMYKGAPASQLVALQLQAFHEDVPARALARESSRACFSGANR